MILIPCGAGLHLSSYRGGWKLSRPIYLSIELFSSLPILPQVLSPQERLLFLYLPY